MLTLAPLVHFAGVALGSLLALLLWATPRGNHAANRWLAAFVTSLVLLSLGDFLIATRWVLQWPHLSHTTDWLIFAVGPCVWIYTRRLTFDPRPSGARIVWHFAPAALCLAILTLYFAAPREEKLQAIAEEMSSPASFDPLLFVAQAQILAYWAASLLAMRRFSARLRQQFSSIEARNFRWLTWMLAVNLCMCAMWMLNLWLHAPWAAWLDLIAVPLGLYVLAFLGLRQPAVFTHADALLDLESPPSPEAPRSPADDPTPTRYARSGLDESGMADCLARLDAVMQLEKPWLENDLTLASLAARTGLTPHHLSQVLNDGVGQSFFEYVNRRRVDEAKRCLADPAFESQTVLEIGLGAGFNSKTAFNSAFRQYAGMTPSQYRIESKKQRGSSSHPGHIAE